MRQEILSVSKAKANLLSIVRAMEEEGRSYILTKDGEPVGALVPMEEYDAYIETVDIRRDSRLMTDLKRALKDEQRGRLWRRNRRGEWIAAGRANKKTSG